MGGPRADRGRPAGRILHAPARLAVLARGALGGLLLLLAGAAAAQQLPTTAHVTGVGSRDVLNVRAAPSATAPILGTLAPTATGIEILGLSQDREWARVPRPEGEGWVARRFLAEDPQVEGRLPRPLACRGTEPFWSVTLTDAGATLTLPGRAPLPLRPLGEVAGFQGWIAAFDMDGRTGDLTVVRRACSDGMSDRPYGLYAMVWDRGDRLWEGCCTLQP